MHFPDHTLLDPYKNYSNEARVKPYQDTKQQTFVKPNVAQDGISVIILNINSIELIIPLLEQLKQQQQFFSDKQLQLQIIVGDTGTTDKEVLDYYAEHDFFTMVPGLKYHFSRCNNHLAENYAHCSHFLFMNNDIILDDNQPDSLLNLYFFSQKHTDLGCVGSYLLFPDHTIQHAGLDFFRKNEVRALPYHIHTRQPLDLNVIDFQTRIPAVTGAFLMINQQLFNDCLGMSEQYQSECQDIDLCLKTSRLGLTNYLINLGTIIHIENGTREKGEENWPDRQLFIRRWSSYIETTYL